MDTLSARGAPLEREFALGVVIQLLAARIEPLTDRGRDRAFAGAAGLARPLFEQVPDRAAADGRLFARFHGLHWLCARLAEERPLALLVDDAHWADEDSLRFLAYLEPRIDEIPACVVLAVRTGETAAAPEALTRLIEREPLTALRPQPLSHPAIAELVRDSLGEETGDESAPSAPAPRAGTLCSCASSSPLSGSAGRAGRPRCRGDRGNGPAVGGAICGGPAAATPSGGLCGGPGARDPRRRRLPGGHGGRCEGRPKGRLPR